ncbi:hypothetical protein, partial [Enterobacter hormaechei]|uniref:hypothetical protein n=1 Tax=Enterobacter hormaechei TaxID=158836 RepID=UPI0022F0F676
KSALLGLIHEYISEYSVEEYLTKLEFSNTALNTGKESFANLMIETSNEDLVKSALVDKKVLITKFDFAATRLRLSLVVN